MSPFQDIDAAFSPFFTDTVSVSSGLAFRATFAACVLDNGLDDPLSPYDVNTNRRRISVTLRICDIETASYAPKIGDAITWEDKSFSVCAISRIVNDELELEARSV